VLFLKKNVIAIGWVAMGDLSELHPDREAFKARVAERFPDVKPGAIPNYGGQTFRFVHEMKPGDWVVYPSKAQRKVYLGEITGEYQYAPKIDAAYPNHARGEVAEVLPPHAVQPGRAVRDRLGDEPLSGEELRGRVPRCALG
jgi:predicted Mrr-cat superfamily restriction endonuclease